MRFFILALSLLPSLAFSEAALGLGSGDKPQQSLPSSTLNVSLEEQRLSKIGENIQGNIDAAEQILGSQMGSRSIEIDQQTGNISFYYTPEGSNLVVKSSCSDGGQCRSLAGGTIECGPNSRPDPNSGSCVCNNGYINSRADGNGGCVSSCPSGTLIGNAIGEPGVPLGRCVCLNDTSKSIAQGSLDDMFCRQAVNSEEICKGFINTFTGEISDPQAYEDNNCGEVAQVEAQREENQQAAEIAAEEQAQTSVDTQVAQAAQSLTQSCTSQYQQFNSSCSQIAASSPPSINVTSSAETAEKCQSLADSSESIVQQNLSQVQSCMGQYNSLYSSCPPITPTFEAVGQASVGSGATAASSSVRRSGSADLEQNRQAVSQAASIFSQLNSKVNTLNSELNRVRSQANSCVAALNNKDDKQEGRSGKFSPSSIGQLAQLAGNAFKSAKSSGGELGSGGVPAHTGNYSHGSYQGDGSYSYGKSGSSSKVYDTNSNLGAYDEGVDAKFNMGSDKPLGGDSTISGKSSALAAAPGARGGGTGFFPSSSDGTNSDSGAKDQRQFKTAKARNLVQGFKSLKASIGGATLSVKPSDYKKYGAQAMKQKLAVAQKKFGKDMPLIFKNGTFVLDYLAMKETEMFKTKRASMEKFWSGEESRKPTYIEELDVHQNPNSKIWSLLNLRYKKIFYYENK